MHCRPRFIDKQAQPCLIFTSLHHLNTVPVRLPYRVIYRKILFMILNSCRKTLSVRFPINERCIGTVYLRLSANPCDGGNFAETINPSKKSANLKFKESTEE